MLRRCRYSAKWLHSTSSPKPINYNPATVPRIYWDSSLSMDNPPSVDYSRLMVEEERLSGTGQMETADDGVDRRPMFKQLLTNLLCYGFTFVDNTPTNLEGTMSATGIISFPQVDLY